MAGRVLQADPLVEASTAAEDEIGSAQQLGFERQQLRCRATKAGEVIHRVVHDRGGFEVPRPRQRHGRVVPEHRPADPLGQEQLIDERGERCPRGRFVERDGRGQVRRHHRDARAADRREAGDRFVVERLLDEEDAPIAGGSRHQVIGTLVHEVPTQMREAHQISGHDHSMKAVRNPTGARGTRSSRGGRHRDLRQEAEGRCRTLAVWWAHFRGVAVPRGS